MLKIVLITFFSSNIQSYGETRYVYELALARNHTRPTQPKPFLNDDTNSKSGTGSKPALVVQYLVLIRCRRPIYTTSSNQRTKI